MQFENFSFFEQNDYMNDDCEDNSIFFGENIKKFDSTMENLDNKISEIILNPSNNSTNNNTNPNFSTNNNDSQNIFNENEDGEKELIIEIEEVKPKKKNKKNKNKNK